MTPKSNRKADMDSTKAMTAAGSTKFTSTLNSTFKNTN